jgi:hypothetical protein
LRALDDAGPEAAEVRLREARANTWDDRVGQIADLLRRRLGLDMG